MAPAPRRSSSRARDLTMRGSACTGLHELAATRTGIECSRGGDENGAGVGIGAIPFLAVVMVGVLSSRSCPRCLVLAALLSRSCPRGGQISVGGKGRLMPTIWADFVLIGRACDIPTSASAKAGARRTRCGPTPSQECLFARVEF